MNNPHIPEPTNTGHDLQQILPDARTDRYPTATRYAHDSSPSSRCPQQSSQLHLLWGFNERMGMIAAIAN